jgi:4-hydroxybenzoate polyprenyltransferase
MQPSKAVQNKLQQAADLFIFSSLFLALCAVGMVYQTCLVFRLPVSGSLLLFTFCGTLCSYNFHWYFTPASFGGSRKVAWSYTHRKLHALLFLVALASAAFFTWQLKEHWRWLLFTAFITFLYSAPKIPHRYATQLQKIAVGKTIFLAFAWAHVTALLPLLLESPILSNAAIAFVLNRFFLIYAICILFDYRDRESDRREGIRSLLTLLEQRGIAVLFWSIMAAFAGSSVVLLLQQVPVLTVVALTVPGVLVAALYGYCLRHDGDYLFYFVLDGLMALSVPLVMFSCADGTTLH